MAGDWMKIELDLPDKPEVHQIASILGKDPEWVVGTLIKIWGWFDKHTTDGNAFGVTFALVDRYAGVSGFGEAMMFAGWLIQNDTILTMPKFDRHTSKSAKKRALTQSRVRNFRNENVTIPALPREEKRRDINNVQDDRFDTFWKSYPRKQAKPAALKAWIKAKVNGDFDKIMESLEQQKSTWNDPQYIPMPSTWINQRRWEDELTSAKPVQQEWI